MSPTIPVVVAGHSHEVDAGTTAGQVLLDDDPTVVAAAVGNDVVDLDHVLSSGDEVTGVPMASEKGREILRHSTAHVLAQAVQELFPQAKLGIGPPVEDGFYYDFDVPEPFTPDDLGRLEKQMQKIVRERQAFARRSVSDDKAHAELAAEPYKLELLGLKGPDVAGAAAGAGAEVGEGELTMYDNVRRGGEVAWKDLCRGPHVPTTRTIPAFKLMRVAAAYWRGSEKNPQLQRIYGTAWESKEALNAYLERLAEAQRRDHRRLGAELDLFSFPEEIGPGLAIFHPKGGVLRKAMEDYSRTRHEQAGYEFVYTPHLTKAQLFEKSGHMGWYADSMYPTMNLDEVRNSAGEVVKPGQEYLPKPMNCPMHILV